MVNAMVNIYVLVSSPCLLLERLKHKLWPWESRRLQPHIVCLGLLPTLEVTQEVVWV